MMRRRYARESLCGLIAMTLLCLPVVCGAQAIDIDKAKTLLAARERYYNLRNAGLLEVQGSIKTNWDVLLASSEVTSNTKTLLNELPLNFEIDTEGKLHLDHGASPLPNNRTSDNSLEKLFRGMDDSVSSFFGTWSVFLLTSPFPQFGSDYTVKRLTAGYQFFQRQGELDVAVDTDNDFAITEIRVSGPELTASLKPILEKTPTGLLLKGYSANSRLRSGRRETAVQAVLDYETTSGLQLLHKVTLDTSFEGAPAKIEWMFTDYRVKVR